MNNDISYNQAIDLIKQNPFNLQLIDVKLIDLRLLRFVRRFHKGSGAWAITGYAPKSLKDNPRIWLDFVINFQHEFGWEDILLDYSNK